MTPDRVRSTDLDFEPLGSEYWAPAMDALAEYFAWRDAQQEEGSGTYLDDMEAQQAATLVMGELSNLIAAARAVERVRGLHRRVDGKTQRDYCAECIESETGHYEEYPCATVLALDGKW